MLEKLLAPVSLDRFLGDHFGKTPLFVKGQEGKFDFLLKPADFKHGLDKVDEIRCVFAELRQASISPSDIKEMFEAGASICITGAEKAHASLRNAAQTIEAEIGYGGKVDFRFYLSPPGKGFDIHYDARIATTLQIEGSKTWWYTDEPHEPFPKSNSPRNQLPAIRRAVSKLKFRKVTLYPGDFLCLPAGVWHRAQAGSGGSLALNLAFNHKNGTILDVLLAQLRNRLEAQSVGQQHFLLGINREHLASFEAEIRTCLLAIQREQNKLSKSSDLANRLYRQAVRKR